MRHKRRFLNGDNMRVELYCEAEEKGLNIGIAKALTEILDANDLKEIAQYLMIFAENNN